MQRSRQSHLAPATAGALLLVLASFAPATVLAAGSAEAGQAKAAVCAACHGVDGNSFNPEWPVLAGQNAAYQVASLKAFKSGERVNVLMSAQVATLTDQDMEDIAAFFASKPRQPKAADQSKLQNGERLYRGGNKESSIAACIACHGPNGSGNAPAGYPAIGGQHAVYTAQQLRAYRSGERKSDLNQMMRNNTARLTDAEIDAVASYVQGLR
jgi:cytochrome c553